MERILFVLGSFIKMTAPNGICVRDISRYLDKYECHYLCVESFDSSLQQFDNIHVVYREKRNTFGSLIKNQLSRFFHVPHYDIKLVRKLEKEIEVLDKKFHYNAIISVVNPTESAEAVYLYKKTQKNFKFVIYEIDPASNKFKKTYNPIKLFWNIKAFKWEKKIYALSDNVIHMKTHKNHFSKSSYSEFHNKFHYLDIPNLNHNNQNLKPNSKLEVNREVSFIYAGNFYPKLRNPKVMIKTLSIVHSKFPITVEIYTGDNMLKNVIKMNSKMANNFIATHMIPQGELDEKIINADFVLSVGNKSSDFLPSKIFYYMGHLKPIIHFYSTEDDLAKKYLQKYPLALLVSQQDSYKENSLKISHFVSNLNTLLNIEFSPSKVFYENTPEYNAKEIRRILENAQ